MNGWIGVDLDGTLAKYDGWKGLDHIGDPIKPMCDRVRSWLSEGIEVRIFTARATHFDQADEWSGRYRPVAEIAAPIDAFCLREFGRSLPITNVKDFGMIELWDDRAVQVKFNTGEQVK